MMRPEISALLTASWDQRQRLIGDLTRMAERAEWAATRVDEPGCRVRTQYRDDALALRVAIELLGARP